MEDLLHKLQNTDSAYDREKIMLQIAKSASPGEATGAIEPYLTGPDWLTRVAAAFAFSFIAGSGPDSLIAALGGSEVDELTLAGGGDTNVDYKEDAVRDAAAYSLACKGEVRCIPRLVRMLRYQNMLNSRRFIGREYDELSSAAGALAPKNPTDVSRLYGPVVERLLLNFGSPAQIFIIRSLNWGGLMNELLCGPLVLSNWIPTNATEEFFLFLIDDKRSIAERDQMLDNGKFLTKFDEPDISPATIARSLISYIEEHDPHLRSWIAPLVCQGKMPLWEELSRTSEYLPREIRALRSCLSDILWRYKDKMAETIKTHIRRALETA